MIGKIQTEIGVAGGENAWKELVRALLFVRMKVSQNDLDALVEAAGNGVLEWCIEWQIGVLKQKLDYKKSNGRKPHNDG